MDRFKNAFGDFFISVIRVGEASGTLAQNLLYLSSEIKKQNDLRKKIRSAMVYPAVILVATLGVTAFLAFFVFPKLLPMLSSLNVKMPASTLLLISIVNFLTQYGIYVIVIVIVGVIVFRYLFRHWESFRYFFYRCMFAVPVISKLTVSLNMVNFARIFSLLLKSGIKIAEELLITGRTFDNLVYRRFIEGASQEIRRGGELAPFLAKRATLFPPFVTGMIQIGEATGNLDENLIYVSEYYEEEMGYKLDALTSIIEPVMLLFMGLLVGFVAISIITPMYSISGNI
jgi:type IV pilus assembly protein PilC